MAKQPRVWTGTQWDTLAVTLPDLSNYSTTTQMNTAIDNAKGLVLVTSFPFTTASTIDVTNCFSSTYANYLVTVNLSAASATSFGTFQLLSGTTPSTASYYYEFVGLNSSGTNSTDFLVNGSGVNGIAWSTGKPRVLSCQMTFFNPNINSHTGFLNHFAYANDTPSGISRIGGGFHDVSASYTGFRLFTNSGTITGTINVYGYRNS